MSDSTTREFKVGGGALASRKHRTRKHRGGDNSGALMQVSGQDVATKMVAPNAESIASGYASAVSGALVNNFGPGKIQQFGGKKQSGGDSTGATVNLSSTRATGINPGSVASVVTPVTSGISPSQPAPIGGGLVLTPPKRKSRISLSPRKGGSTSLNLGDVPPPPHGGTRKARKIHLRVKGVTARLARAKKAKKYAMSLPISAVKAKLVSAGVIKGSSKAPEHMLRTMYTDLLITKKGL